MTFDVMCAGFGRTGTLSLQAALQTLGYAPCWHIEDMTNGFGTAESHLEAWRRLADGEPMDWRLLLRDFRAASDFPICWYYKEILDAFDDIKVVLTVRDPRSWASSVQALHTDAFVALARRDDMQSGPGRVWVDTVRTLVWDRLGDINDIDALCRIYEDHVVEVGRTVPADRLLVFSVKQGWGPLCDFLNQDVPSIDFPHLNERATLGSVAGAD